MKRLFSLLILSLGCMVCAVAQKTDSLKQANIEHLKKQLSITDAKAQQVHAIQEDYKSKLKNLMANGTLAEPAKQAKFRELVDEKNLKLKSVLTADQFIKVVPTTEVSKK